MMNRWLHAASLLFVLAVVAGWAFLLMVVPAMLLAPLLR